jgi:hypothetical protein
MNNYPLTDNGHFRERLLTLRQELAAFRTMSCRLQHEKAVEVLSDVFSIDPNYPGLTIRRHGFCPKETRRVTLGCAHTTANAAYSRLLAKLGEVTGIREEDSPWSAAAGLIFAIYQLDHEKGSLEKRLAVAAWNANDDQEIQSIAARLDEVTLAHGKLVSELEIIRKEVLNTIHQLLITAAG